MTASAHYSQSPFLEFLGTSLEEWRDGYVRATLELKPFHLNRAGVIHGGVLAALLDHACGFSGLYSGDPLNRRNGVTLSLTTNFTGQCSSGKTSRPKAARTCRTDCCSGMTPPRRRRTRRPRNGGAMNSGSRSLNPNDGTARLIGDRVNAGKKPLHPRRCCATCAASKISQLAGSGRAFLPTADAGGSTIRAHAQSPSISSRSISRKSLALKGMKAAYSL